MSALSPAEKPNDLFARRGEETEAGSEEGRRTGPAGLNGGREEEGSQDRGTQEHVNEQGRQERPTRRKEQRAWQETDLEEMLGVQLLQDSR